jgi:hypothetical protein
VVGRLSSLKGWGSGISRLGVLLWDLVVRDTNGEIYRVRYEAVNAMLLNEFLKEHRKVEQLAKQIEALTAGLQKVSAQLELSKPEPQMVNNP